VELRQLRYFATLAEELHFGHAAAREHIVQSALSQHIRRLERELGVPLLERSTHHVRLTASGEVFLAETRRILCHLEQATAAARSATPPNSVLRVAIGDPSSDSMPTVLRALHQCHPGLEIHRVEASASEQCRRLSDGRLDIGFARAAQLPTEVASEVVRLDRVGVLMSVRHALAGVGQLPVERVADEPLLLSANDQGPEFNQFVSEICRSLGMTPTPYPGSAESVLGAADLVAEGACVLCVPRSCAIPLMGTRWVPLVDPAVWYPWSMLWRRGEHSGPVRALRECARAVSHKQQWTGQSQAAHHRAVGVVITRSEQLS
jgi:DNA-binding transcriptional LysR family regulator